jgi:hypothetical protein
LLERFQAVGYDSTRFRECIQLPAEIGQPGFWNDGVKPSVDPRAGKDPR